ncbi:hypothetical protein HaLaN_32371, partial [Haematococcus lacustris]
MAVIGSKQCVVDLTTYALAPHCPHTAYMVYIGEGMGRHQQRQWAIQQLYHNITTAGNGWQQQAVYGAAAAGSVWGSNGK